MSGYKAEGIVLRARDFGEADRVVTILDRDQGKLEAVAKGARRAQSRLRGPCQPFTRGSFLLWHGRTLDGISQAETLEPFTALREDLVRLAAASYMAELTDDLVRERDPAPEIHDLLLESFRWLEAGPATPAEVSLILRAFELRLLTFGGFAPVLEACAVCGRPVEDWSGTGRRPAGTGRVGPGPVGAAVAKPEDPGAVTLVAFSPAAGGVLCPACRVDPAEEGGPRGGHGEEEAVGPDGSGVGLEGMNADPGLGGPVVLLAAGTLAAMRHLARAETRHQVRILRLTPRAAREMARALRAHLEYHLDRPLKSLDFLESVLE
ncbi:MAG: DNA repair protein RecO [Firmicutes bacterium]|nr:DNA repair protein RecO [Bacillota bacterium]